MKLDSKLCDFLEGATLFVTTTPEEISAPAYDRTVREIAQLPEGHAKTMLFQAILMLSGNIQAVAKNTGQDPVKVIDSLREKEFGGG